MKFQSEESQAKVLVAFNLERAQIAQAAASLRYPCQCL